MCFSYRISAVGGKDREAVFNKRLFLLYLFPFAELRVEFLFVEAFYETCCIFFA